MKLADFEQQVWDVENIRIVVRADENDEVRDYNYKKSATETWTTKEFLNNRIGPRVGSKKVVVIRGDGKKTRGGVKLHNLRASYSAK
jgi:hypothetical protein